MNGRRIVAAIMLTVGAIAGWLWGVSVAKSTRDYGGGPLGPEVAAAVGLIGIGIVVVVLFVIAGLIGLSRARRWLGWTFVLAALGFVVAYFVKVTLGCSTASCIP